MSKKLKLVLTCAAAVAGLNLGLARPALAGDDDAAKWKWCSEWTPAYHCYTCVQNILCSGAPVCCDPTAAE